MPRLDSGVSYFLEILMGMLSLELLSQYAEGDTFVETGTYVGDTVQLALDYGFKNIHSIELNLELYRICAKRFEDRDNVKIWLGESQDRMDEILQSLVGQATFWLDAHASGPLAGGRFGGSPLVQELNTIGKHYINNHVIIIDDCRLFGSAEWSGLKKEQVIDALLDINNRYRVTYVDGEIPGDIMIARVI